jgi:hypothetical protein
MDDAGREEYVEICPMAHRMALRMSAFMCARILGKMLSLHTEVLQKLALVTTLPQDTAIFCSDNLPRTKIDGSFVGRILKQDTTMVANKSEAE